MNEFSALCHLKFSFFTKKGKDTNSSFKKHLKEWAQEQI